MVEVGLWKKDTALFCCASESLWRIAQRHGKSEGVEEFGELIPPNSTRRTWTWNPQTIVRWVLKLQSKQVHSNVISSTPDLLDLFDYGWILLDWLDGSLLTHGYAICPCTHHTTSTTLSFNEFLKVPLTSSADHTCEEMLFGWVRCCGFCAKVHSPLPLLVEPNPNLDFHILARCGLACWHCFSQPAENMKSPYFILRVIDPCRWAFYQHENWQLCCHVFGNSIWHRHRIWLIFWQSIWQSSVKISQN